MKHSETWLDVGRCPLRRRDRAAMALALEQVRARHGLFACLAALTYGAAVSGCVRHAMNDAWQWHFHHGRGPVPGDLLRARLALLLRVLLRVDAGDYVALECDTCGRPGDHTVSEGDRCGWCWREGSEPGGIWYAMDVRPLWQEAAR